MSRKLSSRSVLVCLKCPESTVWCSSSGVFCVVLPKLSYYYYCVVSLVLLCTNMLELVWLLSPASQPRLTRPCPARLPSFQQAGPGQGSVSQTGCCLDFSVANKHPQLAGWRGLASTLQQAGISLKEGHISPSYNCLNMKCHHKHLAMWHCVITQSPG